jgi:hypothetical protein
MGGDLTMADETCLWHSEAQPVPNESFPCRGDF